MMTTSFADMDIDGIFQQRKDDVRYNTSYPLQPAAWQQWLSPCDLPFDAEKQVSFYVHIPFCQSLCRFCEYIRYKTTDEETEKKYLKIVWDDMANFVVDHDRILLMGFDIGGGTPTALSTKALVYLLFLMNDHADMMNKSDTFMGSLEASFPTITDEKIRIIADYGRYISRLSFGLQNVNETFLKSYNRDNGTLGHAVHVFEECRKRGVKILNLDIMYGFIKQTEEDLAMTLKVVSELLPEHLTLYELRTNMTNGVSSQNKEALYRMYIYLYHHILDMGYVGRFGGNAFSRIGDEGLSSYISNRMYCNGAYKGFGIAAQSKSARGVSYNIGKSPMCLSECMKVGSFEKSGKQTYMLPPEEMLAKYLAISGYGGIFSLSIMEKILGENPLYRYRDILDYLVGNKFISIGDDGRVMFTPKGFQYYGAILSLFYPEQKQ